ncbi:hypothetical protein QJS10_CPA08g01199 [Acorus calamus]|uniref:Uncharacterized protein n=1 Tax=Acorus calamus TaxID=4465 RepID=A0AAV9E947_ACOCL|nr:hypothetical protein QJS10_CPA08g01199 [Acorus calamus]
MVVSANGVNVMGNQFVEPLRLLGSADKSAELVPLDDKRTKMVDAGIGSSCNVRKGRGAFPIYGKQICKGDYFKRKFNMMVGRCKVRRDGKLIEKSLRRLARRMGNGSRDARKFSRMKCNVLASQLEEANQLVDSVIAGVTGTDVCLSQQTGFLVAEPHFKDSNSLSLIASVYEDLEPDIVGGMDNSVASHDVYVKTNALHSQKEVGIVKTNVGARQGRPRGRRKYDFNVGGNREIVRGSQLFKCLIKEQQMRLTYPREEMLYNKSPGELVRYDNFFSPEEEPLQSHQAHHSSSIETVKCGSEVGLTRRVRKKRKKISEIEATDLNSKGLRDSLPSLNCSGVPRFSMANGGNGNLGFSIGQEESDPSWRKPSPGHFQLVESFKEQMGGCFEVKNSSIENITEKQVGLTKKGNKKLRNSKMKATKSHGKQKKSEVIADKGARLEMVLDEYKGDTARCTLEESMQCYEHDAEKIGSRPTSSSGSSQWQHLNPSNLKKLQQPSNPKLAQLALSNRRSEEPHCSSDEEHSVLVDNETPDSQKSQNYAKLKKREDNKGNKRRKSRKRIHDNDLLISAILKSKDFISDSKLSMCKAGSSIPKSKKKFKSWRGGCKLLPRAFGKGGKLSLDRKWSPSGPRTVLSWMIDGGVIPVNSILQYRRPKSDSVVKDGWVTRNGVLCKCCNMTLSLSDFKVHAGLKMHRPSLNLFLESGKSYTLCQLQAWSSEYKARTGAIRAVEVDEVDQNDDTCGLCGDGGELICCDNCPSTFHQACLPSQDLPDGNWYCRNCTCDICGAAVLVEDASSPLIMLKCAQCERKFHETCLKEKGMPREAVSDGWFCGENCQEIYSGLHSRIGILNRLSDGFSWTILRCIHGEHSVHSAQKLALMADCNTKLAVALTIMEECFLPMVDPRTGINMIPHVLYNWGSHFARLNYEGFFTLVLEKGDEIVSVASIRVHGTTVAEVPLIATCSQHRRQGMCRRLMNAIEEILKRLNVKMMVISAIPHIIDTWTMGFGFQLMDDEEKRQLSNINFMVFPGTVLLKKDVSASMEENEKGMDNDLGSVDNVATKSGNLLCTSTDIIIKKENALLSDHGTRTSDEKDGSCIKILEEDKWNLTEHGSYNNSVIDSLNFRSEESCDISGENLPASEVCYSVNLESQIIDACPDHGSGSDCMQQMTESREPHRAFSEDTTVGLSNCLHKKGNVLHTHEEKDTGAEDAICEIVRNGMSENVEARESNVSCSYDHKDYNIVTEDYSLPCGSALHLIKSQDSVSIRDTIPASQTIFFS